MLLQTWFPSSNSTHVEFAAASAIFFDSSQSTRRSCLPVMTSSGCRICSATPSSESSDAFLRASSGDDDPEWCWNVSFVSDGRLSQTAPKLNAPLTDTAACTRGSNADALGGRVEQTVHLAQRGDCPVRRLAVLVHVDHPDELGEVVRQRGAVPRLAGGACPARRFGLARELGVHVAVRDPRRQPLGPRLHTGGDAPGVV